MNNAKILWGEGLFLRPQHFQHQDSYTEAQSRRVLLAANPFAWGVRDLDLDIESLKNGVLRFNRISAIFPTAISLSPRKWTNFLRHSLWRQRSAMVELPTSICPFTT
jgi:type VI secretion system protein ImpJ